jgi:hypothetical protein
MDLQRPHRYCDTCTYRHAAGTLTVRTAHAVDVLHTCSSCADEAHDHHADQPAHDVRFRPDPPDELCC